MLDGVKHKKGRIFKQFFRRLNGLKHKKGRTDWNTQPDAAARSHGQQDRAREPCAHFPDDARSTRQTPSNHVFYIVFFMFLGVLL